MARAVLVTGGTRGIGAAVSRTMKARGYSVAATYAGNTKGAEVFAAQTSFKVFQWDIGDFDACANGVKAVEASLGSIDILVNADRALRSCEDNRPRNRAARRQTFRSL